MTLSLDKVNRVYFDKLFVAKNNTALASAIKAKVLLVDEHTMPIISMSYTQLQLLQHDVILTEMLANGRSLSTMKHLNCVVYIKPTRDAVAALCRELALPHYHHYQLFFSNTVAKSDLEKIALADEHEVINQVTEVFQDYLIVNDNLFTVSLAPPGQKHNVTIQEATSMLSLLLALKKCPVIKYDSTSLELKRLALEVLYYINSNSNNNLFDDLNRTSDAPPVLLILDRKADPITPLLTPWTYQLMVHEFIGIARNVATLPDSNEQLTLSLAQDAFFLEAMYLNYGDLTDKFQKYVDEYKTQTKQLSLDNLNTHDLSELKKILTRFPEFKKLSNNILKHLNIISEIEKQISAQNLWDVGELQQTIVCASESHQVIRSKLMDLIADSRVSTEYKVKLLLLYVSKYPGHSADLTLLINKLNDPVTTSPPPTVSQLALIKSFNKHFLSGKKNLSLAEHNINGSNNNNIGQIFNKNRLKFSQLFNTNAQHSSNIPKNDNIYMQYIPKLNDMLTLVTAAASPQHVPDAEISTLVPDVVANQYGNVTNTAAQEVIVYFKGGVTYEEARLVHDLHALNPQVNYIIGGDGILNSRQWLDLMCGIVNDASDPAPQPDRRAQLRDIL